MVANIMMGEKWWEGEKENTRLISYNATVKFACGLGNCVFLKIKSSCDLFIYLFDWSFTPYSRIISHVIYFFHLHWYDFDLFIYLFIITSMF